MFEPGQKGQSLTEYAFLLAFIAIVIIVILAVMGTEIGAVFQNLIDQF